ncbi:MAG: hypothetical protein K2Q18_19375 [Bdellovibrionales bacterium]|nr:hypothetical protein [Bdellovibrionales bacterium]
MLNDIIIGALFKLESKYVIRTSYEFSETLSFYGRDDSILDSLGIISFVFSIEEQVLEVTGKSFHITSEELIDEVNSPMLSVAALKRYISLKTGIKDNA